LMQIFVLLSVRFRRPWQGAIVVLLPVIDGYHNTWEIILFYYFIKIVHQTSTF
jgi:hypothetical protein